MDSNVIVYTSQGCPYCKKVKEQLNAWGIQFDERNVSENYEYFEELQQKKIFGTPATYINGKLVLGFQEAKMKKLLNLPEDFEAPKKEEVSPSYTKAQNEEASDGIFRSVDENILSEVYDLVTIGGGPAGASAAVYAARGRLKTLVIDKAPAAGTLAITHKIANYPGVREELTGLELLQRMQEQAHDFGATFVRTPVLSVDFSDPDIKKLEVAEGTIKAKSVFIAVGAKAPSSKIKGEEEFTGRGVSYCSTCDAAFFQDRTVIVTGDNEEAVHEAEALSKFCKEVRFLIPTGTIKGEADLSTLEVKDNVKIYKKYRVKEIIGENSVEKAVVQNAQKELETWEIDGVFLYLAGMKPGTDFLKDAVARDAEGYINVDDRLQTSVAGVFAGGDARRTPIKQAVLSAADGAIAALGADAHVNKRAQLRPQYS
ncbi:FAD-dependent oxidoreductase [Aneurinibacillus aneurinilyticus]|uniref:FAD-dependent oxidoreductase n=1 Tax=Aneurinibacillus aneurinilyticus TaxID=1391 RepID=UPI0036717906